MTDVKTQTKQQAMLQQTFPDLSENEIEAIEEVAWTQSYKAGAMICRQGDPGETLFILTKGQVEISIQPDNESRVLVRRIEAPSYFGEMALLGQIHRSATVTAATDCETLKIDRESFISIVESNRVLLMALSNRISDHLYNNDQTIIAELRKKNDALQSAYDNLAEQEQLRTEFITTLSHELRTPLTSVQGFLHLINKGAAQGKSLEIAMDSVNRNVEKMVQLTNNLLVLYEMHLSEPVVTNLSVADLLIDAMQEARSMEGDYVTPIALTMFPGATRLQGDKPSLSLVLRSLIENALKFSPEYSPISITVSKPKIDEICIEIADEGIGMSQEMLNQIFDPFFRGDDGEDEGHLFSGLGVGLAITRFIVKQHNGRIEVDSKPGQGSVFRLYLPHNNHVKSEQRPKIVGNSLTNSNGFRAGMYTAAVTS
jgi:signal transduction histidine kinase